MSWKTIDWGKISVQFIVPSLQPLLYHVLGLYMQELLHVQTTASLTHIEIDRVTVGVSLGHDTQASFEDVGEVLHVLHVLAHEDLVEHAVQPTVLAGGVRGKLLLVVALASLVFNFKIQFPQVVPTAVDILKPGTNCNSCIRSALESPLLIIPDNAQDSQRFYCSCWQKEPSLLWSG